MKKIFFICCLILIQQYVSAQHVVLISIDGLHPDMYLDKTWPAPNLQYLMKQGTYADHCLSVFPAYTHPAHAAMETGALPARSRIAYNQPIGSKGEWYWYYKAIKAPTIWQALKDQGKTTAAIMWPNVVDGPITYNLSEIWDKDHPNDRATVVRQHAIPKGLYEEIEMNATGKLDSTSMNDSFFSLDENAGRMAAYVFKKYKPDFLALHFACVDGQEHEHGRDADSVRMAVSANDRAIGNLIQAIDQSGLKDSTTVIIVGDHGFSTIHQVMRPNLLIKNQPALFVAAGGSCFLYRYANTKKMDETNIIQGVTDSLNKLPLEVRKLFRIINRNELDQMGADSAALIALAAVPGTVFSSSTAAAPAVNRGPGTLIQNSTLNGLLIPMAGGHHGFDPAIPDMWTGFIAYGAGIKKSGHIQEMAVVNIAPLVASLLGIEFKTPDGHIVPGIIVNHDKK
ncbi:alkaline phosphatase family protein [Mucilaginibacter mali]|uniref:Alkaline phosphatase family protein n=1 Tax=Mucilaginibacter mali TaxID=2740462 RepID=A0A7D4TQU8_9SPHI|nr:ectonucleotide pyrophosphatase/phosphodiesterase [Mucilaginibacter mali]QKJ32853.1 alkaline phosphatase family protein [Mucilaginibacter mali]